MRSSWFLGHPVGGFPVNQSRAAFMASAASFLASYADEFEAEVGEDRYPGLPGKPAQTTPKDAA
ncbi:hypothetical protein [Streptomyces longispororuber]|uniref:hypothetical protein n=1 Tax=Streptomyces longispororuber TaxID=68230 RepID=UPI0037020A09